MTERPRPSMAPRRRTRPPQIEEEEEAAAETEGISVLGTYFKEMGTYRVLTPQEELAAVERIEEAELLLWERLLAHQPAVPFVLQQVEAALQAQMQVQQAKAPLRLRALRQAARLAGTPSARRRLAARMRTLDLDRKCVEATTSALRQVVGSGKAPEGHPALCPTRKGFRAYVHAAGEAERAAAQERELFIKANLRLVVSMARRFRQDLLSLGDLIQEGNIGLMKGVGRYDRRRGVKFSTYASWWIRHAINRALADRGREVRLPVHLLDVQKQVAQAQRELDHRLGRWATTEEIAEATHLPARKVDRARMLKDQMVSLDKPVGEGNEHSLLEILAVPADSPLDALAQEEMFDKVEVLMGEVLKPIEAEILRMRYGVEDGDEHTLKQIGERHGLSRERVRQIQALSLLKLRAALRRRHIEG